MTAFAQETPAPVAPPAPAVPPAAPEQGTTPPTPAGVDPGVGVRPAGNGGRGTGTGRAGTAAGRQNGQNGQNAAPAPPNGDAPPSPKPEGLPARGTYRLSGDAAHLNVFAVSVDAPELFTAIASRANLPLVVDDKVSRKVTIRIAERPARQAITDICSAYGLSVADVDGVTMISEGIPNSPSSYLLSDIATIPTRYVIAASARNLLPVFLQDYVKVNPEQNAVVLSAPTEVLTKFREDIKQFDIAASQIVVELLLVELTDTSVDVFDLPISYLNAGQGPSLSPGTGSIGYLGFSATSKQFKATLTALISKGRARVRANPRIATVSGRQASLFVGLQRYIVTPIESANGGQRNNIDAGVRLGITPFTGGQGQILVDVNAEVSTLSAPDPQTKLPEKSTRTASTTVRVSDGKTIVIGGLTQQEARTTRAKVPILGSLPFIGQLFQSRNNTTTQTELVLFVTPRLLTTDGHLPEAEERAIKEQFLRPDISGPLPPSKEPPVTLPTTPPAGTFPASPPK